MTVTLRLRETKAGDSPALKGHTLQNQPQANVNRKTRRIPVQNIRQGSRLTKRPARSVDQEPTGRVGAADTNGAGQEWTREPSKVIEKTRRLPGHTTVRGLNIPRPSGQTLSSYEPGLMERIGNSVYDTLEDVGLPVGRMASDFRRLDNGVRGAADTVTLGAADEIAAGANSLLGGDYEAELKRQRWIDQQGGAPRMAGQLIGALLGGAGLVKNGWSLAANAIQKGGGIGRVSGLSAAEGGLLSGAHGFGSGHGLADRLWNGATSFGLGAAMGAAAPLVTRAIYPSDTTPARKAVLDTLRKEGIQATAGQKSGSTTLKNLEARFGGNRASSVYDNQDSQFTRAVLGRAGIDADHATPEVLNEATDRLGKRIAGFADRVSFTPDAELSRDLIKVAKDYRASSSPPRPITVQATFEDYLQKQRTGKLQSDRLYQNMRPRLDRLTRQSSDANLNDALGGFRNAADGAMERSILATENPNEIGAWQETKRLQKNLDTVKEAIKEPGVDEAAGVIQPANLQNVILRRDPFAYHTGQTDFGRLARAGGEIMSSRPRRNSAEPGLIGRTLMSRPVQGHLAQSSITPQRRALINAMINSTGSTAIGRR